MRRAKSDENFVGLDNKNYKLSEEDLIIADDEKVVSLAGIMGGINSCVDHNTKEVFLECEALEIKEGYQALQSDLRFS